MQLYIIPRPSREGKTPTGRKFTWTPLTAVICDSSRNSRVHWRVRIRRVVASIPTDGDKIFCHSKRALRVARVLRRSLTHDIDLQPREQRSMESSSFLDGVSHFSTMCSFASNKIDFRSPKCPCAALFLQLPPSVFLLLVASSWYSFLHASALWSVLILK